MSVEFQERALYEGLWSALPEIYADSSPGVRYMPQFLQVTGSERGHVLDAGCGGGKTAIALTQEGFRVTLCDFTDTGVVDGARAFPFHAVCLWKNLKGLAPSGAFDWVFCADVMEHLPKEFTMLAVEQMLRVTRKAVFFGIAFHTEQFEYFAGAPLHKTLESFTWWRDNLREVGHVAEARDLLSAGIYVVEPCR